MFIASLLIIAKNWKEIKYPSMDKSPVAHPYNGLLLSNKKKWTIDTHNLDESQRQYTKWKGQYKKAAYHMIPLIGHSWKYKTIMIENRSVAARSYGLGESDYEWI